MEFEGTMGRPGLRLVDLDWWLGPSLNLERCLERMQQHHRNTPAGYYHHDC